LGVSLLVIQPSSVLPSKSSTQPSFFSASVSSLSAAAARVAKPNAISRVRMSSALVRFDLLEERVEQGLDLLLGRQADSADHDHEVALPLAGHEDVAARNAVVLQQDAARLIAPGPKVVAFALGDLPAAPTRDANPGAELQARIRA